jgi:TonB family protein
MNAAGKVRGHKGISTVSLSVVLARRGRALEEMGKRNHGEANVAFFVDETGNVRVPVVTGATAPEFAQAALRTISTWTYEPPLRAGRPVVAYEALTIQFGPAPKA